MNRLIWICLVLVLLVSACANRDGEVAEQRALVDELANSIVWPEGYEQATQIVRRDPNLDSLNLQSGAIEISFMDDDRPLSEIRDDFNASLTRAGFAVDSRITRCGEGRLQFSLDGPIPGASATLRRNTESAYPVNVQFLWTLPSPDSNRRPLGDLPTCPGE